MITKNIGQSYVLFHEHSRTKKLSPLLEGFDAEVETQIFNRNLDDVASNTDISRIPAHTVHPSSDCSYTNRIWDQQRERRREECSERSAENGAGLTASSNTVLVEDEQPRLAVESKVFAVVLEDVVAAESVLEKVHCSVDHCLKRVRCSGCAGATAESGEEDGRADSVLETVERAVPEETVKARKYYSAFWLLESTVRVCWARSF